MVHGSRGLHARWEVSLVRGLPEGMPEPRAARVVSNPLDVPFSWVEATHALVPQLFADDAEANRLRSGVKRSKSYRATFRLLQGPVVQAQLRLSGERLGDLILTAWEEAGRPSRPPGS